MSKELEEAVRQVTDACSEVKKALEKLIQSPTEKTYRIGQRFIHRFGYEYMLARIDVRTVLMVGITGSVAGSIYGRVHPVGNTNAITQAEFNSIVGGNADRFTLSEKEH